MLATDKQINYLCILAKSALQWLRDTHDFFGQDGEPIRCTGWQFIAYSALVFVASILLSIHF